VPAKSLTRHLVGFIGERLVETYAILSSTGKLTSFGPGVDVDHKDLIFDERGKNRNVYAQVKCAVRRHREIMFAAEYEAGELPSSPRFIYILCLLDVDRMTLSSVWLVPSSDFNRLASRRNNKGRIRLEAEPGLTRRSKWDPYLIPINQIGPRLLQIAQRAPAEEPLQLPDSLLFVRQ
jgi:hypothetical protein